MAKHTLFFLAPPYWKIPGYQHYFTDLAKTLTDIKGHFLMPLNDTPEAREIFSRFTIEEVSLTYSMSRNKGSRSKPRTELLISN